MMRHTIALLLPLLTPAFAQYDLLLKGGHVIDPRNNIDGLRDVAIQAGKIAEVSAAIDPARARKTINVGGPRPAWWTSTRICSIPRAFATPGPATTACSPTHSVFAPA